MDNDDFERLMTCLGRMEDELVRIAEAVARKDPDNPQTADDYRQQFLAELRSALFYVERFPLEEQYAEAVRCACNVIRRRMGIVRIEAEEDKPDGLHPEA